MTIRDRQIMVLFSFLYHYSHSNFDNQRVISRLGRSEVEYTPGVTSLTMVNAFTLPAILSGS